MSLMSGIITKRRIIVRLAIGLIFLAGVLTLQMISVIPGEPIEWDGSVTPEIEAITQIDPKQLIEAHRRNDSGIWLASYGVSDSESFRYGSGWTGARQISNDVYVMIRVIDGIIILSHHRIIEEFPETREHGDAVGMHGSRYRKMDDASFGYHEYQVLPPLHFRHDPVTWQAAQEEYSVESWRLKTSLFFVRQVSFPIWLLAVLAVVFLATRVVWPICVVVHRRRHEMCVCCGYLLRNLNSPKCPECGTVRKVIE